MQMLYSGGRTVFLKSKRRVTSVNLAKASIPSPGKPKLRLRLARPYWPGLCFPEPLPLSSRLPLFLFLKQATLRAATELLPAFSPLSGVAGPLLVILVSCLKGLPFVAFLTSPKIVPSLSYYSFIFSVILTIRKLSCLHLYCRSPQQPRLLFAAYFLHLEQYVYVVGTQ